MMNKYLTIGLIILLGCNTIVLGGAAYNRVNVTSELNLTERELVLLYRYGIAEENSGIALSIRWRTPSTETNNYYPYGANDIQTTESALETLGFNNLSKTADAWQTSRELYWALEFDGQRYQQEIKKAQKNVDTAFEAYQLSPSEENEHRLKEQEKQLAKERTEHSRLFFIEAAANYELLADKYQSQPNILIAKGLAKPYYHQERKVFYLSLQHLSVRHVMVPNTYAEVFNQSKLAVDSMATPLRYAVNIKWGNRLEPWITQIQQITE